MGEISDDTVTAALTFKVPQKVGLSVQRKDQSWTGGDLSTLVDRLATESRGQPMTLSLSSIFEIEGNDGTVRS